MQHLQRRQQGSLVWGFNDVSPSVVAAVTHVLTTTRRLQVTGFSLPECGTVNLYLNTTQGGGQQTQSQAAPPYSLIAYPVQGLPSVYPLSLTGTLAPWTVNYPAGEPCFASASARLRVSAPLLTS